MSFFHYETIGQYPMDYDATDISKNLNCAVFLGAAKNCPGQIGAAIVKPGDNGFFLGLLQNNPNVGEAATIAVAGFCDIIAGGDFAIGDDLTAQADGSFKKASGGTVHAKATTAGSAGKGAEALLR